ncbi:hypothetical protein EDD11_003491 [Mortierella claussenii]|nr:hypothetical protein EDD11_003491 [Mortierella claussenii]
MGPLAEESKNPKGLQGYNIDAAEDTVAAVGSWSEACFDVTTSDKLEMMMTKGRQESAYSLSKIRPSKETLTTVPSMFAKLGLKSKDTKNSTSPFRPPNSISSSNPALNSSPSNSKVLDMENKKALKKTPSYDSLDSVSISPQPHLPSSVYNPNPFPLDPTQPGGRSQHNAFQQQQYQHRERQHREVETIDIDIEVEETKGFVSGKSRRSVDGEIVRYSAGTEEYDHEEQEDVRVARGKVAASSSVQKLGAGLKGALAKSGLTKNYHGDREKGPKDKKDDGVIAAAPADAVLQHQLEQQERQQQQQQQRQQQQRQRSQDADMISRPFRGRERERQRTKSGPLYPNGEAAESSPSSSRQIHKDRRDPMADRASRVKSLSPPPTPPGIQDRRNSATYWPDDDRGGAYAEQSTPFIGYQPPRTSSPGRRRQQQQYQEERQYQRRPRPLSQPIDSDYSEYHGQSRQHQHRSRERRESDRMVRRDAGGGHGGKGVRRQSGLHQVISLESVVRTSAEFGDDEDTSSAGVRPIPQQQQQVPDRLSRAKEWVASHSRNNSLAANTGAGVTTTPITPPVPIALADRNSRDLALAALPGAFPSRPNLRRSADSEEYGLMSPPRGSYLSGATAAGSGSGYDSKERMAARTQMQIQEQQYLRQYQERDYSSRESMIDDGRYWSRQLEGYDERDQYQYRQSSNNHNSRLDYEYERAPGGGFHGYTPGGPDDVDDGESTLAPGSAVGNAGSSYFKKGALAEGNAVAATKKGAEETAAPAFDEDEVENQVMLPRIPNKRRLILRLVSLTSSVLTLVLLIAASPVSKSSSPFTSQAGLGFHYVVAILSILVNGVFVFNYFSRRLRRQQKMKRYILFGLDIVMTLAWLTDVFVCISKFPCAVGGQNGWCDMYNSSVFLGMIAFGTFFAALIWDIWGSFDHSKWFGGRPLIKPPPPGFDRMVRAKQFGGPAGAGMQGRNGVNPGAWPGQIPGQNMGQGKGQGFPMKPKNSKALW